MDKPTKRLSFAKQTLLKRCASAVIEAYGCLKDDSPGEIRELLDGDKVLGAISHVSGITESDIIGEVIKEVIRP